MSLHTLTKTNVTSGNVDNEDELKILVGYKKCLVNRFKEIEEERKQARLSLKDKLLSELAIRYVDKIVNNDTTDVTNDELIYDICGYLLHSRSEVIECCNCKPFLKTEESELPDTFAPANYTLTRTYGHLKLATIPMFQCFQKVESLLHKHLSNNNHIFIRDAFEQIIDEIGCLNLVPLSCKEHPEVLPFLIMEYVQIHQLTKT